MIIEDIVGCWAIGPSRLQIFILYSNWCQNDNIWFRGYKLIYFLWQICEIVQWGLVSMMSTGNCANRVAVECLPLRILQLPLPFHVEAVRVYARDVLRKLCLWSGQFIRRLLWHQRMACSCSAMQSYSTASEQQSNLAWIWHGSRTHVIMKMANMSGNAKVGTDLQPIWHRRCNVVLELFCCLQGSHSTLSFGDLLDSRESYWKASRIKVCNCLKWIQILLRIWKAFQIHWP